MESPITVKCLNSQHSCMVEEHNRKAWEYQSCRIESIATTVIQGGHKPGKLREFEKLSKSQGKLREI